MLEEVDRRKWVDVLLWLRVSDRLLEKERQLGHKAKNGEYNFQSFLKDWKQLRSSGKTNKKSPFFSLFENLRQRWEEEQFTDSQLKVWDTYLESQICVHPEEEILTMKDYKKALRGISGSFFQMFPDAPKSMMREVEALGTLDQFYNNLRDLVEDTHHGLCYFPVELMDDFKIKRKDMANIIHTSNNQFSNMIEHLFATFVSDERKKTAPLFSFPLHYSWKICIENVLTRHARVEYVFRLSGYNATKFTKNYWEIVRTNHMFKK